MKKTLSKQWRVSVHCCKTHELVHEKYHTNLDDAIMDYELTTFECSVRLWSVHVIPHHNPRLHLLAEKISDSHGRVYWESNRLIKKEKKNAKANRG